MDDEEETKPTRVKLHDGATSNDTFLRAILEHEKATDALGAAIRDRDPQAAAAALETAMSYFLAALALFRRMETTDSVRADLPRLGTAWYVVRTHQRALTDLLTRATSELPSPDLHKVLAEHGASLTVAMARLGPRTSADDAPDPPVAKPTTRASET